jgi:RNA polymerase sigma factor (sigma-70 family)
MAPTLIGTVLRHFRHLATSHAAEQLTDSQLLERYRLNHDQAAFGVLMERHGRLVWSVCRHVLRQEQDAEDAFQATFLVLALKAVSIRQAEAVGAWLYAAAYRCAMQLKRAAARRRAHEQRARTMAQPKTSCEESWRELQALLDEELMRLPEKYRAPFVLCCLEGRSKSAAARELGWREGTVSGRLARARQRLRHRLARRGVTLSAALCGVALEQAATAAPPLWCALLPKRCS